ncbi:MAG: GTPase Era [Candidatus Kapabacteria bacterium]|jgi:GTP-binding protein Era|nr:GTPase Era [Candidatus Kapabacteria bacterium]
MSTKFGYVTIIGKPNAGKSTLMNSLLGAKLSIISPKPQTTRKRVLGIVTEGDTQVVFLDTPGIVKPKYELHRSMMEIVEQSLDDADVILALVDASDQRTFATEQIPFLEQYCRDAGKPSYLLINKMDTLFNKAVVLPTIQKVLDEGFFKDYRAISALKGMFTNEILPMIMASLPEEEFHYDIDVLSTQPQRFFVSEIIREVVFHQYKEEIPYSTEVQIVEFTERENGKWHIHAELIVERDSQKAIIIGAKGAKIKYLGEKARTLIEEHLEQKIYLELFVKVRGDWRDNKGALNSFGYSSIDM